MSRNDASRSTTDTLDTAMVGAGVGGLYTAWRLLGCRQPPDGVGVFEASEPGGGRLFSVSTPGNTGIAAEFGGMRFLASHTLITSVATKLGLGIREFPAGGPENILCFRGKQWRAGDIAKKQPVPYGLRADELYLDPFELIVKAVQQVMPAMKHLELNEWAMTKGSLTLDGRPLINWDFCNLLSRFLSDEALQFIEMGIGYSSVMRNWNAADALSLVVAYISSRTEKTLVDGMRTPSRPPINQIGLYGTSFPNAKTFI